jgi:hypothetical protein
LNAYAKPYVSFDPYTYADPCADTEEDVAAAIVMGYSDEEITERVKDWLKAKGTKEWVNEEWYETVSPDSDMTESQFEAAFNLLWDTGEVVRFVARVQRVLHQGRGD